MDAAQTRDQPAHLRLDAAVEGHTVRDRLTRQDRPDGEVNPACAGSAVRMWPSPSSVTTTTKEASAKSMPAAVVPTQMLAVLAREAGLLQHAHAGNIRQQTQAVVSLRAAANGVVPIPANGSSIEPSAATTAVRPAGPALPDPFPSAASLTCGLQLRVVQPAGRSHQHHAVYQHTYATALGRSAAGLRIAASRQCVHHRCRPHPQPQPSIRQQRHSHADEHRQAVAAPVGQP